MLKNNNRWLIYLLCSICLFSSTLVFAQETNDFSSEEMRQVIYEAFSDKDFTQITHTLSKDIATLNKMINIISSNTDVMFGYEDNHFDESKFSNFSADRIQQLLTKSSQKISFRQTIYDDASELYLSFDSELNQLTQDYQDAELDPINRVMTKFIFYDGSSLSDNESGSFQSYSAINVNSMKRIKQIDMLISYPIMDMQQTSLVFIPSQNSPKLGITLMPIVDNVATFELSNRDPNTILRVEAKDQNGKLLLPVGKSSLKLSQSPATLDIVINFYSTLLEQIEQKKITDKQQFFSYIDENVGELSTRLTPLQVSQWGINNYLFEQPPNEITLFLAPTITLATSEISISNPETPYHNELGLAYIRAKSEQFSRTLIGLVNQQGEWVIQPEHHYIKHLIGDYYEVRNYPADEPTIYYVYRINVKNREFELQPFHIINSRLWSERWVLVNEEPLNNEVKGLLDLNTNQLYLPLQYDSINIVEPFIVAAKKTRKDYEVYNIQLNKKVFAQQVDKIIVDKNNFISQKSQCTSQKTEFYSYSKFEDNETKYCYDLYDLYNDKGKKLSLTSYINIFDGKFDEKDLLKVLNQKNQIQWINRKGNVVKTRQE